MILNRVAKQDKNKKCLHFLKIFKKNLLINVYLIEISENEHRKKKSHMRVEVFLKEFSKN
jgi:hypothetical protein